MGNLIGVRLGAVASFVLLVGAFFFAEGDAFAAWSVVVWLPIVVGVAVVVVVAALALPRVARGFTTVTRLSSPAAAALAVFRGGPAAGVVLALLAAMIWCAHWLSGRRITGRSTGGVFRDIRYALEGITRR